MSQEQGSDQSVKQLVLVRSSVEAWYKNEALSITTLQGLPFASGLKD